MRSKTKLLYYFVVKNADMTKPVELVFNRKESGMGCCNGYKIFFLRKREKKRNNTETGCFIWVII